MGLGSMIDRVVEEQRRAKEERARTRLVGAAMVGMVTLVAALGQVSARRAAAERAASPRAPATRPEFREVSSGREGREGRLVEVAQEVRRVALRRQVEELVEAARVVASGESSPERDEAGLPGVDCLGASD